MQLHQPNSTRRNIPPNWHGKFFVRVERQTMMMLRSGDILFTIRTYLNPLRAITQDQVLSTGLQNSILNTDPEVLNYRGIDRFGIQVMRAIDQPIILQGPPAP